MGVPPQSILIENKSSNTGENIKFTQELLRQKSIQIKSLILVQKPYMERRTYATFMKNWITEDEINIMVTSPKLSFDEYLNDEFSVNIVVNVMVGDLQRIRDYPARGFQIYQYIPPDVLEAFEQLVSLGFDKHLIK